MVSLERGRPGMDLWQVFVLGVMQKALNCDFDRLLDYAEHHEQVRQMLGHADFTTKRSITNRASSCAVEGASSLWVRIPLNICRSNW